MPSFLSALAVEIEKIKTAGIPEPTEEVQPGEDVVGEITDPDIQALYWITKKYMLVNKSLTDTSKPKLAHYGRAYSQTKNLQRREEMKRRYDEVKNPLALISMQCQATMLLYMVSLRLTLLPETQEKLGDAEGFGMRKGWKIIITPIRSDYEPVIPVYFHKA